MKKLLFFNESAYNARINEIALGIPAMDDLLKEFDQINLFKISTNKELEELVKGGEKYIKQRIAETIQAPTFGLFKMKKAAFVDTLELPSFDKLNEKAEIAKEYASLIRYYSLKGGSVVIDAKEKEILKEQNSVIAKTPEQVRFGEAYTNAAKALNEFHNALKDLNECGLFLESKFDKHFILQDNVVNIQYWWLLENRGLFTN